MWSTSLLFLLSLLGASASQPFYVDGHQHSHGFVSVDDSEYVVKTFLDKMTKTIGSRDTGAISDLFADDFFFKGCKGDYDKKRIVSVISIIEPGTAFSFTFKSAKYLSAEKIDYSVIISGFGPTPVEAQFLLSSKTGKLSGGSVPACRKTHYHGFITQSSAQEIVEKFNARAINCLKARRMDLISDLFEKGFEFSDCGYFTNKRVLVSYLSHMPAGTKFNITLRTVEDHGDTINYIAAMSGFAPSDFVAELVLNKLSQKLEKGKIPVCQESQSRSFYDIPHIGRSIIFAQDDAQSIVQQFLVRHNAALSSKDASEIGALLQDNFFFQDCRHRENKETTIRRLVKLPNQVAFTLKSLHDSGLTINYILKQTGVGPRVKTFEFVLNKASKQLESGRNSDCPTRSPHHSILSQKSDAEVIVDRFLKRMTEIIESHDDRKISELFDDNFVFKGCKGTYNKQQITNLLNQLPSDTYVFLKLVSARFNTTEMIEFTVSADGFGSGQINAQFIISATSKKLQNGSIPACKGSHSRGLIQVNSAKQIVENFLARMTYALESRDSSALSRFFKTGFVFAGCNEKIDKIRLLEIFSNLAPGRQVSMSLQSVQDLGSVIKYSLTPQGIGRSGMVAEFILNKKDQQLESGTITNCEMFAMTKRIRGFNGFIEQETASSTIDKFLSKMIKTVESHNETLILDLYEPDFSFKGCKAVYNREQSVAMLMFIPSGTKFSYNIKSVEDNGNGINCVLLATGLGQTAVEFDFVVSKKNQKLMSAVMPVCPIKNRFADVERPPRQIPDATEIITDFLGTLKKTLATHDSSTIGKIFDDNFVFKGCSGSYSKAETIALISKIPSESNFDFTLKPGAAWNNNGQIEYTVTVSGALRDHFDAQFVYCPYKNVLKSGSIPSCSSRRMLAKPCIDDFGMFC